METAPNRHCVSLSDNFGLSSNGSSALSMSLGLNNASPISPRINRTVPVTISPCGYAKSEFKACVIFFVSLQIDKLRQAWGPARHYNSLNALAFPRLSRVRLRLPHFPDSGLLLTLHGRELVMQYVPEVVPVALERLVALEHFTLRG